MSKSYEYYAELQLTDGSLVTLDLEEHGWADPERLARTRVFTLVPKEPGGKWPFVRIHIPDGAKPIFKTRRNMSLSFGIELFRAYAVGWFKDGESHWTWIFPNGAMEKESDDPSFNDLLVKAMNDAIIAQKRAEGTLPSPTEELNG